MNDCGRSRREGAPFRVSGTASALMRPDDRNERRRGCVNTPRKARTRCRRARSDRRPEPSSPARCPRIPAVQTVVLMVLHQEILAVAVASVQNQMSRAYGKGLDVSPFPAFRVSGTASALMRPDDRNERRRGCVNTPRKARTRCRRARSDRRPEPSSPARCPRIPAVQTVVLMLLHQEILAVAVASVQKQMSRAYGKGLDVSPFPESTFAISSRSWPDGSRHRATATSRSKPALRFGVL